jgi:hypothetical protein
LISLWKGQSIPSMGGASFPSLRANLEFGSTLPGQL